MIDTQIIKAKLIITMDQDNPRATAMVVRDGLIATVGTLEECQKSAPTAPVTDLGQAVICPGFIETHGHPVFAGMATMPPAGYIAPWVAPTWEDVVRIFREHAAQSEFPLVFFGFDQLLHGVDEPTSSTLDDIFGDRMVAVINNSGHGAYVTSAVLKKLGWLANVPEDPVGAKFLRHPDGSLTGQAHELPAVIAITAPVLGALGTSPLLQAAQYYALMARAGITSTTEMTYGKDSQIAYEALAQLPHCPLRVSVYHMSTDAGSEEEIAFQAAPEKLHKQGVKLWADGSPWIGNIAISFPYLDSPAVRRAKIRPGLGRENCMNYTREQLDAVLDKHAPHGWQMAFHVNGDLGFDVVLDAYESALKKFNLLGTDHRWRVEHVGGAQEKQFRRAAELGVVASMGPFQFYYWGDLLDGQMFDSKYGANWQQFRTAFDAGVFPSFHNDGSVSPPDPLLNIQTAVTRRTSSGTVRGPDQAVTLDQALAAQTIYAAYAIHRDKVVGLIGAGKWADFVILSQDPYAVSPDKLATDVKVLGTWLGGKPVDLEKFIEEVRALDHTKTHHLIHKRRHCC